MEYRFKGKVALVTGSGSGIGKAAAILFARAGLRTMVADLSAQAGEETVNLIRSTGGEASFVRVDVSSEAQVDAMVAATLETFGGLDYAFNNAARRPTSALTADAGIDEWRSELDVNLIGVWLCMRAELRHMLAHGGGSIVNTSSGAGLSGLPTRSAYTASKHGVIGLTKAAALEYARQGIRINAICPGTVRTPMLAKAFENPAWEEKIMATVPCGRIAEPEEIAEAALWLCSDAASYITGTILPVDGGFSAT